jgi:phage tail-like protein
MQKPQFSGRLHSRRGSRMLLAALCCAAALCAAPSAAYGGGFYYAFEVEDGISGFFTEAGGIGSESELVETQVTGPDGQVIVRKLPGRLKWSDVILQRGITDSRDVWAWRKKVEDGDVAGARKDFCIILYDDSTLAEIARWSFVKGWPALIDAPYDDTDSTLAVETLVIVHEGCIRELTISPPTTTIPPATTTSVLPVSTTTTVQQFTTTTVQRSTTTTVQQSTTTTVQRSTTTTVVQVTTTTSSAAPVTTTTTVAPAAETTTTIELVSTTTSTVPRTAVTLEYFTARAGNRRVTLSWKTGSETDNAGFNIYRATAREGAYVRVNDALIPARGSATLGSAYTFIDSAVKNRQAYYYKLEDIDLGDTSTTHGPVKATPRRIYEMRK